MKILLMLFSKHDTIKKMLLVAIFMLINILFSLYELFTFIIAFGFLGLCFIADFCSPKSCKSYYYLDPLCWMVFLGFIFPVLNIIFFYLFIKMIRE